MKMNETFAKVSTAVNRAVQKQATSIRDGHRFQQRILRWLEMTCPLPRHQGIFLPVIPEERKEPAVVTDNSLPDIPEEEEQADVTNKSLPIPEVRAEGCLLALPSLHERPIHASLSASPLQMRSRISWS